MGDIFSYGILLLEIFTRKKLIDKMFIDGLSIHKFTSMALPEHVMDIVEPSCSLRRMKKMLVMREMKMTITWNDISLVKKILCHFVVVLEELKTITCRPNNPNREIDILFNFSFFIPYFLIYVFILYYYCSITNK